MHSHSVRGRGVRYSQKPDWRAPSVQQSDINIVAPSKRKPLQKHDNNCCREININLELDDNNMQFQNELRRTWNLYKQSPPVENMINNYFNYVLNPYVETIKLLYNCQDFNNAKHKTLPFFIIEQFKKWSRMFRNNIIHLLTVDLKIDVFKIMSKQNSIALSKLIIETYEMDKNSEIFLEIIRCLIDKKKYKEACQYASLLNLHTHFTINDFLVPLILQDKLSLVDDFLKSSPQHQADLVCYLDSWLEKRPLSEAVGNLIEEVPDIKMEKLHSKPMKKLIGRLLKMFSLPNDLTPNLNRRRNEGALQFLLHKRFVENGLSDESWKEMVIEAVRDDKNLQLELIQNVSFMCEVEEAIKWAHYYNIDRENWTQRMRLFEDDPDGLRQEQRNVTAPEENWDDELEQQSAVIEYHTFNLPRDVIHLVDSVDTFEYFLYNGLKDVDIVGIDCEWKPTFGNNTNELALMQISSRKNVFILDIIMLGKKVPDLWVHLGEYLFNNCDILKLGFSFSNDIKVIRTSIPVLKFSPKQLGLLDLDVLWKQIEKNRNVKLPYEVQNGGPSLSLLVQSCLGRSLNKSEQFSNWEKRPLREEQLIYAALDAYCLIEVYDVLKECCEQADIVFDEMCYNIMTSDKYKKKPKKSSRKLSSTTNQIIQPASPHTNTMPANCLKVVCDTSLSGLVKNLRRCGIDSILLGTKQDPMDCVRLAHEEQRYILTKSSSLYTRFSAYVQLGHCLKVNSEDVDAQLKEVLTYYKVIVKKDNVFSRCQECNGNNFIKLSRSTINTLINGQKMKVSHPPAGYYDYEATGFSSDDDYFDNEASTSVSATRKWNLYSDEKIDVGLCKTKMGANIQVNTIPEGILPKYDFFYVCEECGKVYWDGSHFERVVTGRLAGILT